MNVVEMVILIQTQLDGSNLIAIKKEAILNRLQEEIACDGKRYNTIRENVKNNKEHYISKNCIKNLKDNYMTFDEFKKVKKIEEAAVKGE